MILKWKINKDATDLTAGAPPEGQLLSLTRFVDQPERLSNARRALRGRDHGNGMWQGKCGEE